MKVKKLIELLQDENQTAEVEVVSQQHFQISEIVAEGPMKFSDESGDLGDSDKHVYVIIDPDTK